MARLPVEAQRISYISAVEYPGDYTLPSMCAHPRCDMPAFEAHHIVRRSYTQGIGPQTWIAIDGKPVPNLVGLCRGHHADLERNEARIKYIHGEFFWSETLHGGPTRPSDRLSPVPLIESDSTLLSLDGRAVAPAPSTGVALDERDEEGEQPGDAREPTSRSQDSEEGETAADGARAAGSSGICPTCQRKLPKPKAEHEPERAKVTWAIRVPKDAQEDGYELLRSLVEQCQQELGRENEPPYYVLVEVMHFFLTSAKEVEA